MRSRTVAVAAHDGETATDRLAPLVHEDEDVRPRPRGERHLVDVARLPLVLVVEVPEDPRRGVPVGGLEGDPPDRPVHLDGDEDRGPSRGETKDSDALPEAPSAARQSGR